LPGRRVEPGLDGAQVVRQLVSISVAHFGPLLERKRDNVG
jgi:hypothetical protein